MVLFVVGDVDVNHIYKLLKIMRINDKEAQPQIVGPLIEQTSVREPIFRNDEITIAKINVRFKMNHQTNLMKLLL